MIGQFLNQTMTVTRLSYDELGREIATETEYPCRLERTYQQVANDQGEYTLEQYRIYAPSTADVKVNDRIMIESGDDWTVKSVFRARGFSINHLEISV